METAPDFKTFATCAREHTNTTGERALAFLYYRSRFVDGKGALQDVLLDFQTAGLGRPIPARVREVFIKDRRTRRAGPDTWMIPSDKFVEIESELGLNDCLTLAVPPAPPKSVTIPKKKPSNNRNGLFVDPRRIKELKNIVSADFDLTRLIQMCIEINDNFTHGNHISTALLVRAVLDHIPPIFGMNSFAEVSNNFKTTKSTKDTLQNLENSSRKIADRHLHTQIRRKEDLPTKTQVNFSQDFDVLLAEIILLLK